ncbi:unnamed protein product [Staurois parvus]|uniref:Uncharacterized protein n=1 Tax=Staurois parvus TaxID=386267 RepID=A0ABN9EUV2_9NEOB|nr:unnamed protein product [Staurois parvus]
MHSPKKKKNSQAVHTKLSMCNLAPKALSYQQMDWRLENRIKHRFYTMQRINPLCSKVSITSMLYCMQRHILLLLV